MDTKKKPYSIFDHLKAIIALPFMVTVVIPIFIFHVAKPWFPLHQLPEIWTTILGVVFLLAGFLLFVKSLDLFIRIGKGTLAPWNPTRHIVVESLYRYMRNPMLLGVNLILLGEATFWRSGNLLIWNISFLLLNHFYFLYKEEPDLERRFGEEYQEYCRNVPRWIPRWPGWYPEQESGV